MKKQFNGTARISQFAINSILNGAISIKQLDYISGSVLRIIDKEKQEYILNITDDGIFAGYIEF